MFDTTPNGQQPGGASQPENAPASFESMDYGASAIDAGKLKPVTADSAKDVGVPGDDVGVYEFQAPHSQNKWILVAFAVLGVAALAGLAWWAYIAYTTSNASSVPPVDAVPAQEVTEDTTSPFDEVLAPPVSEDTTVSPATTTTPQQEREVVAATDTDGDGLSDADEVQGGSDPRSADSDKDGLTDREEVLVYGTSPTNPDSDGDTYPDGTEVQNGYNPKGTGLIGNISATSTSPSAQ